MKRKTKIILALLSIVVLGGCIGACAYVPPALHSLALRAKSRRHWTALRRYARSVRSREVRGLAYFALGYREYQAGSFPAAAGDFSEAVAARCSLGDFAEYYEALARRAAGQFPQAIQAANSLVAEHPESFFRVRGVELLADLLIDRGHPDQALRVLAQLTAADARKPAALLLRARAEAGNQNLDAAAEIYQKIYYGFPAAGEAKAAKSALQQLSSRLGKKYPPVTDEVKTSRVEKLFAHGDTERALEDYDALLLESPHSKLAGAWQLGRARCLLALRRYPAAAEALKKRQHGSTAEQDSARLALLIEAYARADDEPSMLKTLDQAYKRYPHSPSYAEALFEAGGYFARQGYWQNAAQYYQPLCDAFPGSRHAPEAAWRLAWYEILAGHTSEARTAMLQYLKNYPGSLHASAALYWLARLDEEAGADAEARELDAFVARRFANTFYGWEARRELDRRSAAREAVDSPDLPVALSASGISLPAPDTFTDIPCRHAEAEGDPALATYATLDSLGLDELAGSYLQDLAAHHRANRDVLLAIARLQSSRGDTAAALFTARRAVPNYADLNFDQLQSGIWELLFPRTYWSIVRRYARANRLDPYLVMGIIRQESAFDPHALSGAHARGLMQMEPETATRRVRGRRRRRRVVRELYNPSYNIRVSCRYLRSLLQAFDNRPGETLAAYNAGDFRVRQWLENSKLQDPAFFIESIPFTDTRAYVELVLRDAEIYRSMLSGTAKFKRCGRGRIRG